MFDNDGDWSGIPERGDGGGPLCAHAREVFAKWERGNFEGTFREFQDDVVYHLHVSEDLLRFAGESVGKPAVLVAFRRMREDYEYILFRPFAVFENNSIVRMRIEFMFRHKASNRQFNGKCRMVVAYRDGLIARMDEYHDQDMVRAFVGLCNGDD